MKSAFNYYSRKIHRYLGIFLGIQFLFWTIGGLYFSWTNIEEIRGEHLRKTNETIALPKAVVSPEIALSNAGLNGENRKLTKFELVEILGRHYYSIGFSESGTGTKSTVLIDAASGDLRKQISLDEAVQIATAGLIHNSEVAEAKLISSENVGGHHEYRGKPLPAYAVSFENPSGLVVYVAAATGKIESFRTNQWRVFDFLWMLHTMDFYGRDDFNNNVLRWFSVFGVLMLLSGFVLFFVTSPTFIRILSRKRQIKLNE